MSTTQPITVFIADDHPIVRSGIKGILANAALELVGEASNGVDLLHQVVESQADVLILDLNMPDFEDPGGFVQALTQINPRIRTLVLTSYSDPDLSASLINNGATGFLVNLPPIRNRGLLRIKTDARKSSGKNIQSGVEVTV